VELLQTEFLEGQVVADGVLQVLLVIQEALEPLDKVTTEGQVMLVETEPAEVAAVLEK
jgi:hypothetical protein